MEDDLTKLVFELVLACEAGVSIKPGALAPGTRGFRVEPAAAGKRLPETVVYRPLSRAP